MDAFNPETMYANMTERNPYDQRADGPRPRNPIVRAGMSAVEMAVWLIIMAVLAVGMIVLLWNVSK